jgi:hypothetical protein
MKMVDGVGRPRPETALESKRLHLKTLAPAKPMTNSDKLYGLPLCLEI